MKGEKCDNSLHSMLVFNCWYIDIYHTNIDIFISKMQ